MLLNMTEFNLLSHCISHIQIPKEEIKLPIVIKQVWMGDMQPSNDTSKKGYPNHTGFAIPTFFSQFPEKVQKCLKVSHHFQLISGD